MSLMVVVFLWPFLSSGGSLPSDWDYFAQLYEASRKSIVEFHQFPWWNAWHMGGIPLYANPQFGVFSLQTICVVLFGTLTGLKVSVLAYMLAGFWGMRQLLIKLKAGALQATLLSYIWIFSAFPMWHLSVGHFTFVTYLLAPWIFYFLLDIHKRGYNWLWTAIIATIIIQSSFHYTTIQLFVIAALFMGFFTLKELKHKRTPLRTMLFNYSKVVMFVVLVNSHKVYHTLAYLHDYPRIPIDEERTPLGLLYASLTFRGEHAFDTTVFKVPYLWHEYTAYFGIITLVLFIYLLFSRLLKRLRLDLFWVFVLLALLALTLALGPFGPTSPYGLLKQLPGFEQMQVATRWLGWAIFLAMASLAFLPKRKIINVLLILALVDVIHSSAGVINRHQPQYHASKKSGFEQYAYFSLDNDIGKHDMRLFRATQANAGEVYGYEPILGFAGDYNEARYDPATIRCGVNRGCSFIMSGNAIVSYWSPNKIVLTRTAPGQIELNMNPGSEWRVNGKNIFQGMRLLELNERFIINDLSENIIITSR